MAPRTRIEVTGIVQGVGFRPFVHNLAHRHQLGGYCRNTPDGLLIEVEGEGVDQFIHELKSQAPPLSRIDAIRMEAIPPVGRGSEFVIRDSLAADGRAPLISPDIATCPDCLRELFDPADRRYRYPFINCTNCGPRYSIVLDTPYDRSKTTMASFAMCAACEAEYHDPANRRFHAQPNACPQCGPKIWLRGALSADAGRHEGAGAIGQAIALLKEGKIGAIKGLGGFHLACDAANQTAVERLRDWKRRSNKPFALMMKDVETVRRFCTVTESEERILAGGLKPIVLLEKLESSPLAEAVAPRNDRLGVMLPYTPLHALLLASDAFEALVMTSGNLAEEPIVIDNDEAIKRFSVADFFLLHDRNIYMRVDDSIVTGEDRTSVIRRSRGFVPETIDLGEELDDILACGAELKNTFCLTKGHYAILSQHIGDLQNWEAMTFFKETLANLRNTYRVEPKIVAHDLHPDYMSTTIAQEYAKKNEIPPERVVAVQHHHAHIASCMAEHGLHKRVIGIAFDGTGYGEDGHVWGGEFLLSDRAAFKRMARLRYIPMPGGDKAAKEPWRMTSTWLFHILGKDAENRCRWFFSRFDPENVRIIRSMLKDTHLPLTSSMGRLFDAVSSLLGLVDINTFEGEAAMALEAAARRGMSSELKPYPFRLAGGNCFVVDPAVAIAVMVANIVDGVELPVIAARFHLTIAGIIGDICRWMRNEYGIGEVVLSGGVFQNRLLADMVRSSLAREGFSVWTHEKVPCNDGGIALGQAVVAWERVKRGAV
ncbi:MAG: carbamoyltransferase HypF [Nitrospirota bacterium]|nr:carbamoyltransferase HypF [Nitrospirota bacterium]